jgi:hypothetical protein
MGRWVDEPTLTQPPPPALTVHHHYSPPFPPPRLLALRCRLGARAPDSHTIRCAHIHAHTHTNIHIQTHFSLSTRGGGIHVHTRTVGPCVWAYRERSCRAVPCCLALMPTAMALRAVAAGFYRPRLYQTGLLALFSAILPFFLPSWISSVYEMREDGGGRSRFGSLVLV